MTVTTLDAAITALKRNAAAWSPAGQEQIALAIKILEAAEPVLKAATAPKPKEITGYHIKNGHGHYWNGSRFVGLGVIGDYAPTRYHTPLFAASAFSELHAEAREGCCIEPIWG